jgi:peptidoglycan/LPS O-acetylase OafA/YrhL
MTGAEFDRPAPLDTVATDDPGKQTRAATGIPVVAAFDGYRAYGILGIVLLHILGSVDVLAAVQHQPLGVLISGTLGQFIDILFIVSGFVVFLPTVAHGGRFGNWRAYAIRRAARLVPAYWMVLVLMLVLLALFPSVLPVAFPPLSDIAIHFGFLHGLFEQWKPIPIGFGIDGPVWTLSVEVTFYVILPFIASAYFRRPFLGLLLAATVAVAWKAFSPNAEDLQFPAWAFSFAVGMTGAWTYVRLRDRYPPEVIERRALPVQAASFASLAIFAYLAGRYAYTAPLISIAEAARHSPLIALGYSGSLATLMVSTALGSEKLQRPFAHPFARWLGDISYGIYLIHIVVIYYAVELLSLSFSGSLGDFLELSAIVLPISILYGYLSARFLEQPIRRWAQRFGRSRAGRGTGGKLTAKANAAG